VTSAAPSPGSSWGSADDSTPVDSTYLDIGGQSPPPMKTLVYSPDVQILIARGNKQYDVSADIVSVSVARVENAASTLVFRLTNKGRRYTPLFAPMDRVICKMKRVEWVQVFSGYLDSVPLVQLFDGTCDFRATCTIKRLIHTWWDPGLPASSAIFDQFSNNVNEADGQEGQPDAGLGSTVRRLLVSVGNWDSTNIHVQRFPTGYYTFMEQQLDQFKGTDDAAEKFRWMLLGDDTSGGVGPAAGQQLGVTQGGYSLDAASRKLEVIRAVDDMGMGPDTTGLGLGQAIGVAATGGTDTKDQEAWKAQTELGKNYSQAAQKNDAAVHCFMTIMAESSWIMYANNLDPDSLNYPHEGISTDNDSEGLFQQRRTWGTTAQRMNPRASTGMFLQVLKNQDWRNMDRAAACQAVQRSGTPDGSNYAKWETEAVTEVQAIRTGTQQSGTAQSNTTTTLSTGLGAAPPSIIAGAPGLSGITGIPSTLASAASGGTPLAAAASTTMARPAYDTQGAINFAMAQLGKPYVWGATGPASYDCSGLTEAAYKSIGIEIGRDTYAQARSGTRISMAQAVPGDLIQPASGEHVVMYLGANSVIHAPQTGDVVKISPLWFTPATVLHFPPAQYGGPGAAPFNPAAALPGATSGSAPGTIAAGSNGGTASTGSTEPIARNLFSYQFDPGRFASAVSEMFGGGTGPDGSGSPPEAAFINDEPLIQTVTAVSKAGLRNFQSMPNGDLAFYFPDYFGIDGKQAVIDLEDIEMKDVKINLNDDALATHVYVAGTTDPRGASMGVMGWLNTKGIATVENEWLFRRMASAAPQVKGAEMVNGPDIMKRYGVRPLTQSMAAIQNGAMEFLMALQIFMQKWAEQYSTTIDLTFLPELYPGMRINLKGHNLQVYVSGVTHSGDFENGFTTSATIMAPSNPTFNQIATSVTDVFTQGAKNIQELLSTAAQWFFPGSG
jgi:cell wall-associated NlpC family hydrolase